MRTPRLAYDDPATATEMSADCRAVEAALRLPPPSIRFEDVPSDLEPTVDIDEAAARLAAVFGPDRH